MRNPFIAPLVGLFLMTGVAHARTDPAPAASGSGPVISQDLAAIKSQTMLYKAEAARRDAQADATGTENPVSTVGGQGASFRVPSIAPVVMGVFGAGDDVFVRVAMPDGAHVDVAPGTRLPGGQWRVKLTRTGTEVVPVHQGSR